MTNTKAPTLVAPMGRLSLAQVIDAWYMRLKLLDPAGELDIADSLLIEGEYGKALEAYISIAERSPELLSRQGFVLHLLGRSSEGLLLMDHEVCLAAPASKAALAVVQHAADGSRSSLGGASDVGVKARAIEAALDPVVSPYAVRCFWHLASRAATSEQQLEIAARGLAQSGEPYLRAWEARSLHRLGRAAEIDMQQLSEAAVHCELCAFVLLEITLEKGPWAASDHAIKCLQRHAGPDERRPDAAALLQAVVDVSAARATSEMERAERALSFTSKYFHEDYVVCADRQSSDPYALDDELCALLVRLEAARILGLGDVLTDAAAQLGMTYLRYPLYQPSVDMVDLTLGSFRGHWWTKDLIDGVLSTDLLPPDSPLRWMRVVIDLEDDRKPHWNSVRSLARHCSGLAFPDWMQQHVATVQLATGHPNLEVLGTALARWSIQNPEDFSLPAKALSLRPSGVRGWVSAATNYLAALPHDGQVQISPELTSYELIQSLRSSGGASAAVALIEVVYLLTGTSETAFRLAFAMHADGRFEAAARIYRQLVDDDPSDFPATRNLALAHARAGQVAELLQLHAGLALRTAQPDADWPRLCEEIDGLLGPARQSHAEANKTELARAEMRACNARLGAITDPSQLTLGQATALLALLRGSDIDHATWEIAPLSGSQVPFGPSPRFLGLVKELAHIGAVGVTSVANRGIQAIDGGIEFDWSEVTFKILPSGLDLQRAIRDLPRAHWPLSWTQELETLAISVAVEECMAYIWHLADERSLPLPEDSDLRGIYRSHLQHASVGRCWYFTFRTIQSANDYRTRVRAGRPQIAGYILNKLRQVGETAIENNWLTSYSRLRALPRSNFAGALHDVLTGWGDSAFDSRIRDLVV